jgi:hypothetical protein
MRKSKRNLKEFLPDPGTRKFVVIQFYACSNPEALVVKLMVPGVSSDLSRVFS